MKAGDGAVVILNAHGEFGEGEVVRRAVVMANHFLVDFDKGAFGGNVVGVVLQGFFE